MKQFGKLTVTNREFELLVKKYVRFYETVNKCSEQCPVGHGAGDGHGKYRPKWVNDMCNSGRIILGGYYRRCFCTALPMFPDDVCPCNEMKEKAFIALEEMVKEYAPQIGIIPKVKI